MAYQSKTWSAKRLSYVPLLCAGLITVGIGMFSDYGLLDELITLVGGFISGWSVAALLED